MLKFGGKFFSRKNFSTMKKETKALLDELLAQIDLEVELPSKIGQRVKQLG